ncbi:hypothetical protein G4G28_13370 [Massilia sp. Dwa41.01b]|uniref:hypothetical protein n=1 Tax=Massilia sp. Dwa41.01b TaxID=2709302 RepID=UPI00160394C3|nr:hypothetical protein [Massilia sp. Dwa41.01b]QNA89207.1 hypothetical protein G4G28_13370 [Massilia sp. Dwa41.01b]
MLAFGTVFDPRQQVVDRPAEGRVPGADQRPSRRVRSAALAPSGAVSSTPSASDQSSRRIWKAASWAMKPGFGLPPAVRPSTAQMSLSSAKP